MNRSQKLTIVAEIKKEYLKEHLDQVSKLIEVWIQELSVPLPYSKEHPRGWQVRYSPSTEQNSDDNHMTRKHLKSRTLWRHHTNWEEKLDLVFSLMNQAQIAANDIQAKQSSNLQKVYTSDYLDTALWQGFELASGNKLKLAYKTLDNGKGIALGGFKIETEAATSGEYNLIIKEHEGFINEISQMECMKKLVNEWSDIKDLRESMKAIANRAIKSNDILHPCRFCKHLWK